MKKRIWITGGAGLVGSNLCKYLRGLDYDVLDTNKKECNLLDTDHIRETLELYNPNYIIHCAAKAGGIGANCIGNSDFLYDNVIINSNLLNEAAKFGIKKLIAMSSVSVFETVDWDLTEDDIFLGNPFIGDFGYGWAKRIMDVQCSAIKLQYGYQYTQLFLTNTFGPNDYFNLDRGHLMPCLLLKTLLAIKNNVDLEIWGDGLAKREFIYIEDIAKITSHLIQNDNLPGQDCLPQRLIVSTSKNVPIQELVNLIVKITGFSNKVIYNVNKPNGQTSRKTNNNKLLNIIPDLKFTSLVEGITKTWDWLNLNYPNIRI